MYDQGIIQKFMFKKMFNYYLQNPFLTLQKSYIIHYVGITNKERIREIKRYHREKIKKNK